MFVLRNKKKMILMKYYPLKQLKNRLEKFFFFSPAPPSPGTEKKENGETKIDLFNLGLIYK